MILETLGGGLLGGVFRLVPEFLKSFDRKNDRKHELAMLEAEMRYNAQKAEQAMRQVEASMVISENSAIAEATREQGETARAAGGFVSAISALVRPLVTYWFVFMYSTVKIVAIWMAVSTDGDWQEVLVSSWTPEDMSILMMILSFFFVGRVYDRLRR